MAEEAYWYVVHTYSGYENKVKANLEKIIENNPHLQDFIHDIVVPMEEQIEIKDGKKKATLKKVFPGYVLVKMIITDESWYVVRNIRGVTGLLVQVQNLFRCLKKRSEQWEWNRLKRLLIMKLVTA